MIKCYNENLKLSPQGLIDANCSYHAVRNASLMVKILLGLRQKNDLYSKEKLEEDILSLRQTDNNLRKIKLTINEIYEMINDNKLSDILDIIYYNKCNISFYNNNNFNKFKQKKFIHGFIITKKRFGIYHWIPIVVNKKNEDIDIYILDSYHMGWWGDIRITKLIKTLFPNYSKKKILCSNNRIMGDSLFIFTKLLQMIFYFIALYLFMRGVSIARII